MATICIENEVIFLGSWHDLSSCFIFLIGTAYLNVYNDVYAEAKFNRAAA